MKSPGRYRILAIDDDPVVLELTAATLAGLPVEVLSTTKADEGLRLVRSEQPQLVLLDLVLPGIRGMELLTTILECQPRPEVVLMTAHYSVESAVKAIQKGAYDYLVKPFSLERLQDLIERWMAEQERQERRRNIDAELLALSSFEGVIGQSPVMVDLFSHIQRIAPHFRTALIYGATGTGKDLIARHLHRMSPARNGPFIACNCGAITETLFESEFFGYTKGAFTGAVRDQAGLIEAAAGGTLFLDEVGEFPLPSQAKLLRFLQSGEVRRVGSTRVSQVQVRVVAATNRNPLEMVEAKTLRDDLYYRLAAVEINVPPLEDRRDDIPLLVNHFLANCRELYGKKQLKITNRAMAALLKYSWPGNVRELENLVGSCAMTATDETIDTNHLPPRIFQPAPRTAKKEVEMISLEEVRERHIANVLDATHGSLIEAARVLKVGRSTLWRLLRRQKGLASGASR